MVPLENSIEGSVSATLDALATGPELSILAEEQVDVTFSLLAPQGVALGRCQGGHDASSRRGAVPPLACRELAACAVQRCAFHGCGGGCRGGRR